MRNEKRPLFKLIAAVRRRRHSLLVLRGASLLLASGAAGLLLLGWVAERNRFRPSALSSLRVTAIVALLAGLYFLLIRPLMRKISDRQLARFIEERQPALANDRLVTAIEIAQGGTNVVQSWAVAQRLSRDADAHAAQTKVGDIIPSSKLYGYAGLAAASTLLFAGVLIWGPRELPRGVTQLIAPGGALGGDESKEALAIKVVPGSARVPRGSDQRILATLSRTPGAEGVTFYERNVAEEKGDAGETDWRGQLMEAAKAQNDYQYYIFNIQNSIEYYVESGGVRSETYRLDVVDLPFVNQLDVTLNYPAFTNLPAKTIEDGGEVAAVRGTVARLTAKLSGKVRSARVVTRDGKKIEMSRAGETDFVGSLTVSAETSYHVELTSVDGEVYRGSNEYDVVVLEDEAPIVSFEKPGRDMRATSLEEVFTQVKAEDDFGVSSIEMYFSVNGQAERRVDLQKLNRDAEHTLRGVHTFFLEEHGLKPGDFVSYYAKARDAAHEATSDIYFIEIKPFELQFKQSQQQQGGGGGGGGEGEDQNALTRRQKDLIAATFKVIRAGNSYSAGERVASYSTIEQGQQKLRDDTRNFIERLRRRLSNQLEGQEKFAEMIKHLGQAATEMQGALPPLEKQAGGDALPAEQRALQQLLTADSIFREMQVAFNNNQSGGGGGESRDQSQELSQLFELELDKMKNQYETVRREQRQQSQQQKGELENKLEELARRQQQAAEQQQRARQNNQPANGGGGGGGGGGARQQQELIEETRKAARELERLSRERRDARLQELSNQLKQAADEMQQSQAAGQSADSAQGAAQARRAADRLEQARRRLQGNRQNGTTQNVGELRRQAAEAAARQREIVKDLEQLARGAQNGDKQGAKERLAERKNALADSLNNLEQDLEQTAQSMGNEEGGKGQSARQLREAAGQIKRGQLGDQIRRNNQNIEREQFGAARGAEQEVQRNLDRLAEQMRGAEQSARSGSPRGASGSQGEENLDRTRQLADDLDSMRRRLEENARRRAGQQQQQSGRQGAGGEQGDDRRNNRAQRNSQEGRQQESASERGRQGDQRGNSEQASSQQSSRGQQQQGQGQQQQGQQSSQGQSSQGGQQGQQQGRQQGGSEQRGGSSSANTAGGSSYAGEDDARQLNAELRERLNEARELRRQIGGEGPELRRDLDVAIRQIEDMVDRGGDMSGAAQTAAALKSQVVEPLRQLEMALGRRLQTKDGERKFSLGDEGIAPERYRKSVDEYYKRLSNRGASGTK